MAALKFLVMSDFSPLSKVAVQYAMKMVDKLEAEITIMNVVRLKGVPKTNRKLEEIEKTLREIAEEEGASLVEELKRQNGQTPLTFKVVQSDSFVDTVLKYTEENYTNLVVMGSKELDILKKARMGGTTLSVIDSCYSPVLAVPRHAVYKEFRHVVYASDLKNVQQELEMIIPFARIFDSYIHMVHIVPAIDKAMEQKQKEVNALIKNASYPTIDFKIMIDDDLPGAIDYYIHETRADLLTTFTSELSLYEKLFGLSVTRKLAYQGNIPLLAFKRRSAQKALFEN